MFAGLKKGLQSVLYVEEETEAASKAVAPAVAPIAPVVSNSPTAVAVDPAVFAEIDKGLQAKLMTALEGADASVYRELDDFLDTMADAIPDENLRWKKGLEFLAKKGHTVGALLSDVDKCIGVLEDHGRLFSADVSKQLRDRVGSREQSVQLLSQQIDAKEAQKAAMEAEIIALRQKRDTDQAAISTETAKVERVQSRFEVVFPAIMADIKAQRVKLESFLPKGVK
jgi:hypothetical protein